MQWRELQRLDSVQARTLDAEEHKPFRSHSFWHREADVHWTPLGRAAASLGSYLGKLAIAPYFRRSLYNTNLISGEKYAVWTLLFIVLCNKEKGISLFLECSAFSNKILLKETYFFFFLLSEEEIEGQRSQGLLLISVSPSRLPVFLLCINEGLRIIISGGFLVEMNGTGLIITFPGTDFMSFKNHLFSFG